MATYVGFSTQHAETIRSTGMFRGISNSIGTATQINRSGKNFRTVDEQLIIQDFINSLNITQGEKPGNPAYGTILWGFIFEPNTTDVRTALEAEIQRVIGTDPRIILNTLNTTTYEAGIMMQLEIAISPFNNPIDLSVTFDQASGTATLS
jgi:phage baseplate assembly protein W